MSIRMVKCHTVYEVDLSAELEAKDYVILSMVSCHTVYRVDMDLMPLCIQLWLIFCGTVITVIILY